MQALVNIYNGVTRHPDYRLDITPFQIIKGQPTAICGPNGAGKSLLVDIIRGAHPLLNDKAINYCFSKSEANLSQLIKTISFRDVYGGIAPPYYQQRWNKGDSTDYPTVRELFDREVGDHDPSKEVCWALRDICGVTNNMDRQVNTLSSGELRRFQLTKSLLFCPELLIIDNPYIGLDVQARQMLTDVLKKLSTQLTLLIVVSRAEEIPTFIETVIPVVNRRVDHPQSRMDYLDKRHQYTTATTMILPKAKGYQHLPKGQPIIDLRHINLSYDDRRILQNLSWTVRRGEHWSVSGENGAGKTTLLSLLCADNPMAYAQEVYLFGRKLGSGGSSIWDIKQRIGYVSPEMFSTYMKDLSAIDIVASGLHDTIGLYSRIADEERVHSREWMEVFGIGKLADRSYLKLSSGEQRLILLTRAFVKQPELLILDEPFHGLDDMFRQRGKDIIDAYMNRPECTLIMITHYENELPRCIDKHLYLKKNY